jgi:hypothetical protein
LRSPAEAAREPDAGPTPGLAAGLVLAACVSALYRSGQWDYWFHLAAGRSIVHHGLPASDPWALAARGLPPWLGEWLFHVALYGVHALGGDVAVGLWRALWAGAAMVLCLALVRTLGASGAAAVLLAPLVLAVSRARLAPRPEQLTLAFALLALWACERARRRDHAPPWWLAALSALWANVHTGWVLGPAIAALYAACLAVASATRRRAPGWALLVLAMVAAAALTPRPFDTLTLRGLREASADPAFSQIDELARWSMPGDLLGPYTALLVAGLLATVLGARRAWRASPPLTLAAVAALAGGFAAYRLQALAVAIAYPALAVALDPRGASRLARARLVASGLAGALGVAALVEDARFFRPGIEPEWIAVPVRAAAVADSLQLDGPMLNTSWYGPYLLWARGESHPPFVDTRMRGRPEWIARYRRARVDSDVLVSLVRDVGFTHAILEPPGRAGEDMARLLGRRPRWSLVFADDAGLLYVRDDVRQAVAAARGYRWFGADYEVMSHIAERAVTDTSVARIWLAELERARAESPWHARASLWRGLHELASGRPHDALPFLDEAERLAPILPGLALRQGLAREQSGDRAGARAAYARALHEPDDAAAARAGLERVR